ncbi:alpha/beta fold hydrolase [Virgibacillus siamensis]|uniref:alpha/beta fold hydrolase n=1 Tax=Virgibacillus siamensis TaxID=480071 RepID=UPI000984556D|nr:alpha/beta hydrolase [Virgibacillus siamensis]
MELYYEVHGTGHPVVLITGGADTRNWKFITPLLAKHCQVVAFDLHGAGKSPNPAGPFNYVEDLLSLIDFLGFDEVTLIGHSMGGQIAAEFALNYPDRVSTLIMIAPALNGFKYSQEFNDYIKEINAAAPDIDHMIEISLSAPLYNVVMSSSNKDLMVQMLRHHMTRMFEWPTYEMVWSQPPTNERLGDLTAKTLLLIGLEDSADNLRVAEYYENHSNTKVIRIPDVDHMVTFTHPEVLSDYITNFIQLN